ncbi:3-deoxy-D-manno-octulosonic acid transferase [Pseudohalocynthiibacter aestuariivivens]|nr:glycosyltransferase N-terminal domain-containing protein [Pseudohalocynthiibacter aestuariivivens]QIE46365.1 3-deoxy-D-manno-octulosonic acid transferase [Pseudohalocynthiibacter aestuariivivens]
MARSRPLADYVPWPRRAGQPPADGHVKRPEGALIWGHALTLDHAKALVQLTERLAAQRPGALHLMLTMAPEVPMLADLPARVLPSPLPDDVSAAAEAFLDHWQPDLCLWTGGGLRPTLIACADRREIPLYLIDAEATHLPRSGWRWLPDLPRGALTRFSMILARSKSDARHLQRMGIRESGISVSGVFREGAMALPHDETLRGEMAECLRGRPVWLAAMVQPGELDDILRAHRTASKLAHRLFLVLVPDDLSQTGHFIETLREGGWRHVVWSEGGMPEETTQVLLADTRGEMGLWYRLATITLMGSSLKAGQQGRDPNEPAAHGSAIMHGPNVGRYLSDYSRYAEAGAACVVRDADTLSAVLARLIAPDQSAAMAHAAWDVASASAQVTDQILDLIHDTLDVLEAG